MDTPIIDVGKIVIRTIVIALCLLLAACKSAPQSNRPALWEVTSPNGARGWVFGTVHALPDGLEWRSPKLDAALARSDALVLEIAPGADDARAREVFLRLGTTPGRPPLESRVPPALHDELREALAETRLDPAQFATLEDWAAALTLSLAIEARRGFDPANGADRALIARAGQRPVIGLETLAGQLLIFDRLPGDTQAALLAAVVAESDDETAGDKLVSAWAAGDVEMLADEAQSGMLADARLRTPLLVDRNRAWLARIEALLRGGRKPFVAVGAAHVVGADGLPRLLESRGWKVVRVQ